MKKFIALLAALAAAVSMLGCLGASAEFVGMANPNRYDVGFEEMLQVTGIELRAPADAEDISFNIIGAESEAPMAEVTFSLNGRAYCYRAQPAAAASLHDEPGMDASAAEIMGVLSEDALEAANISGIYTEWTAIGTNVVSYRDAILMQDGKTALLSWMDPVPGILYNLSVNANLNIEQQDAFVDLAEELFVPMQADVSGDPVTYRTEEGHTVTLTGDTAEVSIVRLTRMEGIWHYEGDVIALTLIDANDGEMHAELTPAEDGSFCLTITDSSWSLLPTGDSIPGFMLVA